MPSEILLPLRILMDDGLIQYQLCFITVIPYLVCVFIG